MFHVKHANYKKVIYIFRIIFTKIQEHKNNKRKDYYPQGILEGSYVNIFI